MNPMGAENGMRIYEMNNKDNEDHVVNALIKN